MVPELERPAIALVVLIVLAGCAGLVGEPTETPSRPTESVPTTAPETNEPTEGNDSTPTEMTTTSNATKSPDEHTVEVVNGPLSVDQDAVFERVQTLLETDVRAPSVVLRNLTERKSYDPERSPFFAATGLTGATLNESSPGGVTIATGRVYLHPADGGETAIERVLAHEFAHTVQIRSGMLPWLGELDQPRLTVDLVQTRLALTEGGAVFATDAYGREHQPDAERQSSIVSGQFRDGSPAERLFWARYYFGHRYVDHRVDSASDLERAYEARPRTTVGIIHNLTRGDDPPRNLTVRVNGTPAGWTPAGTNRMGELVTRIVLETELSRDRAATAAAGWGNDSLYGVRSGDNWAWAWTFRWDAEADADEFESAFVDYAEGRTEETDLAFEHVRTGETTTVVFIGDPRVIEKVSASADGGNVSVSLGG